MGELYGELWSELCGELGVSCLVVSIVFLRELKVVDQILDLK